MSVSTRALRVAAVVASLLAPSPGAAQTPTAKIVGAADAFLATLDSAQRARVLFPFDDEAQRKRWSNLPTTFVKRGGLALGDLSAPQRAAAMTLLGAVLSRRGYEKVQQIVEADEVLKQNERGNPMFGRDLYYLSILGRPSESSPWMLQFGGHHLAVNVTVAGARGILTPTLTV